MASFIARRVLPITTCAVQRQVTQQVVGAGIRVRYASTIEDRLKELNLVLPKPSAPKGSYISCRRVGDLIYTAGHLPIMSNAEQTLIVGKVGDTMTVEEANKAAEWCALNILTTLKGELGSLEEVKSIVKLVAFVNCTDGFTEQPKVANGCSDLLFKVFGDRAIHCRSAVGTNALPLGVPVEIEAIVEVKSK
eukprot:m.129917 g.129917  ORF g.129917 m.129917 type:complete len:192 (+) comp29443_c0_seq1:31-606(+)